MLPSREYPNVYIKDEGLNPTGSFKARGLSACVTMARHFRPEEARHPFRRQRRRSARRLRRRRRTRSPHLHAERCPHGQPHRVRLLRRARHAGRRPHQRLRPQSRGAQRFRVLEKRRMVRRQHHQRALPRRRQEDHGLRSRRTTGMENAARHHLSHRRRRRPAGHVEGLRRNGSAGLDQAPSARR